MIGGGLLGVYTFLYITLRQQDYASPPWERSLFILLGITRATWTDRACSLFAMSPATLLAAAKRAGKCKSTTWPHAKLRAV